MMIKMKMKTLSFMMMNLMKHFSSTLLVALVAELYFPVALADQLIFVFLIFSTFVITLVLAVIAKVHLNRYLDHLLPPYVCNLG